MRMRHPLLLLALLPLCETQLLPEDERVPAAKPMGRIDIEYCMS